ncbi:MAG TPA: hypothetical protein VL588_08625, partial [Bdellovibrionota bacterium]|nr:hypothetical protein [Bdellovibrionota bacterium]
MRSRISRRVGRTLPVGVALAAMAAGLTACDDETRKLAEGLVVKLADSVGLHIQPQQPAEAKKPDAKGKEGELTSEGAKASKEHAELLQEMYRVVYDRDIENRSEYGSLVDTLNQGASLEGVYNGFTHSSNYRRLEVANPGATPAALNAFGKELARLTLELPAPTEFDASAAQPLATPVQPGLSEEETADQEHGTIDYGSAPEKNAKPAPAAADGQGVPAAAKPPLDQLATKYSNLFVGASIFTLKRILGDEALKVMAVKKEYREKFALWYSQWVVAEAGYGVDFGLDQRNKADADFHYA